MKRMCKFPYYTTNPTLYRHALLSASIFLTLLSVSYRRITTLVLHPHLFHSIFANLQDKTFSPILDSLNKSDADELRQLKIACRRRIAHPSAKVPTRGWEWKSTIYKSMYCSVLCYHWCNWTTLMDVHLSQGSELKRISDWHNQWAKTQIDIDTTHRIDHCKTLKEMRITQIWGQKTGD